MSPCHWLNHYIIKIQLHPDDLVAVQDSDWIKQGPFLCCKVSGSHKEQGCPVHNCITSPCSWQGFQNTGVGAPTVLFLSVWTSRQTVSFAHNSATQCLRASQAILSTAQALGWHCGALSPGQTHIWQWCTAVTMSLPLHQKNSRQATPSCFLTPQSFSNAEALVLAALSARSRGGVS